ncbi:MAG: hypothetical protein QOG80_57 [Pseudonocardiales bacterium]|nr:hypothetical protein [Pseudonocardiales bacterium]
MWRSTAANVAGSVLSVAVAVGVVLFVVLSGRHQHAASRTSPTPPPTATMESIPAVPVPPTDSTGGPPSGSASGSTTGSATASSSGPATPLTEDLARQIVVEYLNDVNARNRTAAGALICQALYPTWRANIDAANSDFNFTVTNARFTGSTPDSGTGGLVMHYTLNFNDNTTNDVGFTVVNDSGPKICGVAKA